MHYIIIRREWECGDRFYGYYREEGSVVTAKWLLQRGRIRKNWKEVSVIRWKAASSLGTRNKTKNHLHLSF